MSGRAEVEHRVFEQAVKAFRRCSPSAPWSVRGDLERQGVSVEYVGGTTQESRSGGVNDYPIGHLARLAGELAAIFGQQSPERLRELGTSEAVIAEIAALAAAGGGT